MGESAEAFDLLQRHRGEAHGVTLAALGEVLGEDAPKFDGLLVNDASCVVTVDDWQGWLVLKADERGRGGGRWLEAVVRVLTERTAALLHASKEAAGQEELERFNELLTQGGAEEDPPVAPGLASAVKSGPWAVAEAGLA